VRGSIVSGQRVVLAAIVTLLVWPAASQGAPNITGATIDGRANDTPAPSGSVLNATVTGTASFGAWAGTRYRFGTSALSPCINTNNVSSGNTDTVSLKVTAPRTPGAYDARFTGYNAAGSNDCGGAQGNEFVLGDALRVTTPERNEDLDARCGINVMLVLDKSGSIQSSGQTENVRNATRAFLDALSGTGASVSIVDFSSTAAQQVAYTTVTPESITQTFEPYLRNVYKPSGYTNWQAAFAEVREANAHQTLADLVVFITDGDPTARTNVNGTTTTGLTEGDVTAMRGAQGEADQVKIQGSHVFALGVGAAVTTEASASRLTAVSGFDEYPKTEFGEADFTLVQDFDDLAASLRQIVLELCQASLTVTKLVDEGDGIYRADPGWEFTATVSTSPGSYAWVQPPPPPSTGPRTQTTKTDGTATFQWKPSNSQAASTLQLTEAVKPGYVFVDATCSVSAPTRTGLHRRTGTPSTTHIPTVPIGPNQYETCTVRNRITTGTIEIEKVADPRGDQAFPFTSTLGDFTLVDNGTSTASKTFIDVAPGTYTVSELVPGNWTLTGVVCHGGTTAIDGAQVTITLPPSGAVVCTYSDVKVIPPSPPNPDPMPPPVDPTPAPVPPEPPTAPADEPSTRLRVVKLAPRNAQVGRRLTVRLRVTNVGTIAATNVRLADIPPAAATFSRVQATGKPRFTRGDAIWDIGTLAPGASRTVKVSAILASAPPGLKRNLAAAIADNAGIAGARADIRLRRAAAPRVTG
jgi:uncharacterized repeat protein (TIGR01451 family)